MDGKAWTGDAAMVGDAARPARMARGTGSCLDEGLSRSLVTGISGYKHSAAVAVYGRQALQSVCPEERVTRVAMASVRGGGLPKAALEAACAAAGGSPNDVLETVVAEPELASLVHGRVREIDHHLGHAATAFFTSPFRDAVVVVCDTRMGEQVTVWRGTDCDLRRLDVACQGPGFASLFSQMTRLLGFGPGSEATVEALTRSTPPAQAGEIRDLVRYRDGRLVVAPGFERLLRSARGQDVRELAAVAAAVQGRLAELVADFLEHVRRLTTTPNLCVGGGLFYNSHINTVIKQACLFEQVHVPVDPGNGGLAAGCALLGGYEHDGRPHDSSAQSPFLGPEFTNEEIKAVLDNCKLSYSFADDAHLVRLAAKTLAQGRLVGWFKDRMEWGRRALGNRSIFASPVAPYVLENLNAFLKHRPAYRTYGLMVAEEDVGRFFDGPPSSPYMECEFVVRDPRLLASACPKGTRTLRVQTVGADRPWLLALLRAFGDLTGMPVLINTSFNTFHEPIVCAPRDAIRVFYGSGLDLVVLGNFVLGK